MASESRTTVLIAAGANLVIAVAKFVAGAISGSPAILAEGAHSVADTFNQGFLLISLQRGDRPPDEAHPFGYGKERFFWAFVASIGILVLGAGFSFLQGIGGLVSGAGETSTGYVASYIVLAVAAVADGISWFRALRQTEGEAKRRGQGIREHIRQSTDPTVKTVLFEDSAALIGVAIAFAGIGLAQLTGVEAFDPIASILIGVLLTGIAFRLGQNAKDLLLGAAARKEFRDRIRGAIEEHPQVDRVVELLTMVIGPSSILVAARVALDDRTDGDDAEDIAEDIDTKVRKAVPSVSQFFLDPTSPSEAQRQAGAVRER